MRSHARTAFAHWIFDDDPGIGIGIGERGNTTEKNKSQQHSCAFHWITLQRSPWTWSTWSACAGEGKLTSIKKYPPRLAEVKRKTRTLIRPAIKQSMPRWLQSARGRAPGEQVVDKNEGSSGKCPSIRSGLVSAHHERFRFGDRALGSLQLLKGSTELSRHTSNRASVEEVGVVSLTSLSVRFHSRQRLSSQGHNAHSRQKLAERGVATPAI